MTQTEQLSQSPEETREIARQLAQTLQAGDILFLHGDLAAGKTVFVRGLVEGLGGDDSEVDSPTFVILQSYPCRSTIEILHHLDLYRLQEESLESIGLEEILADPAAVTAIEWPDDRVLKLMAADQRWIRIEISETEEMHRRIRIEL